MSGIHRRLTPMPMHNSRRSTRSFLSRLCKLPASSPLSALEDEIMKIHHALVLFSAAGLIACGGAKPMASPGGGYSAKSSYDGDGYQAESDGGGGYDAPAADGYTGGATATSAPAGRSARPSSAPQQSYHGNASTSDSTYEPAPSRPEQPRERPGLGTVFGENVNSHVRMKTFVRATSQPFAAVAMHYNDEEGVRAHAAYRGRSGLAPYRAHTPAGGISVALTDQYGNLLHGGDANGRALIVGQADQRYNIVIQNQTGGRYEVVASVDGLDVIDGRPANLSKRGYILEPYSTLTIDGFRRSQSEVAAFRFGRVSQSYAARTSGDRNVGVIGAAFFAERGSVWTTDELHRRDTADPFPGERGYAQPPPY